MLKNTAVIVAAALALAPSLAHAEFQSKKSQPQRIPRSAAVQATMAAMNAALTVDTMVDKINTSYITGLRRCYNKGLALDPSLTGKVTVTFSVSAYGNVAGEASGISPQVDACVATQLKSWKFGRQARSELPDQSAPRAVTELSDRRTHGCADRGIARSSSCRVTRRSRPLAHRR